MLLFRRSRASYQAIRIVAALALASITVAGFSSCDLPSADFSEYVGVDFLESHGFDSDWIPDETAPYLRFEAVASDVATEVGLPPGYAAGGAGTAVFRIEILNLIPNGDFERTPIVSTNPAPGWSVSDADITTSPPPSATITANARVAGNNELSIAMVTGDDVWLDLNAATDGAIDGPVSASLYALRFDFDPAGQANYFLVFDDTPDPDTYSGLAVWESTVEDASRIYRFPFDFDKVTGAFSASSVQNHILLTNRTQSLAIDNLRLVRTDLPLSIRIGLPYSETGRPDLISGTYTFAVWLHSDPTAGRLTDPSYLNRFAATATTLGIGNAETSVAEGAATADGGSVDFSDWYRASTTSFVQVRRPSVSTDTVIELHLSPTDLVHTGLIDSGSMLVTAPSLTYSPD